MKVFLLAAGSFETNKIDNTLLNEIYNKFFENDIFNSFVFEANVQPI